MTTRWNKRLQLILILGIGLVLNLLFSFHMEHHITRIARDTVNPIRNKMLQNPSSPLGGLNQAVFPRAFLKWNHSLPCLSLEREDWGSVELQSAPASEGLLYVKVPKASSTTGGSVNLRIASRLARKHGKDMCRHRGSQHSYAVANEFIQRNRTASILWSIVREPTLRTASEFFHFEVSRRNREPTDENFMAYLKQGMDYLSNFQLRYLALHLLEERTFNPVLEINTILEQYDFLGTTERMDESIVALAMILGLETQDVMFLSQKTSGGYDDGQGPDGCTFIQKSFVSPSMLAYFASPHWKWAVHWDEVLYHAANRSLDLTIEYLGRDAFEMRLSEFRHVKRIVDQECGTVVRFPCTRDGVRRTDQDTDCLVSDLGCGFQCMDGVFSRMKLAVG